MVLIGGSNSRNVIIKYNTVTNTWINMGNLIEQTRYGHSCALLNNEIIVSGGSSQTKPLSSTEIIPLLTGVPRMVVHGELKEKRRYFGMMAVGGRFPQIMTFGGKNKNGNLKSIEVWDSETEKWSLASFSMKHARFAFGFLNVPESTICNV